jgi:hypothetical protein
LHPEEVPTNDAGVGEIDWDVLVLLEAAMPYYVPNPTVCNALLLHIWKAHDKVL